MESQRMPKNKLTPNMTSIVELIVHMDCDGCKNKVKKTLHKLKGVDNVDVNMNMQKVTVIGWADQKKVLKAVRKIGRKAEFWPYPCTAEYHHNASVQEYYYQHNNSNQNQLVNEVYHNNATDHSKIYNYYMNIGSNGNHQDYGQQYSSSTVFDDKAMTMFSDDNPHACSIM